MILHHEGFPIRKSADRCLFTAPRSLSQLVTSFFGSWCQGIHLMLLVAWTSLSYITVCSLFELSEFHFTNIVLVTQWKGFILPYASFLLNLPPCDFSLRWNCSYLPKFGKTLNNSYLMSSVSVRFNSFLSLFDFQWTLSTLSRLGRSGWTRTIDLTLIRRAL